MAGAAGGPSGGGALTQEEVDSCRDAFLAFDKDRSGTIDVRGRAAPRAGGLARPSPPRARGGLVLTPAPPRAPPSLSLSQVWELRAVLEGASTAARAPAAPAASSRSARVP